MKYILNKTEDGIEKVYPLDDKTSKVTESKVCKIRTLLYFTIPENDNILEDYIENHLVSDIKTMLLKFDVKEISTIHIERGKPPISALCGSCGVSEKEYWKNVEKYSEEYDIIRIFVYIEIPNCPDNFKDVKNEVERNFAYFVRNNFESHLNTIEKMGITQSTDKIKMYNPTIASIFKDRLDLETLDFVLHFEPKDFNNSLENFEEAIKRDLQDENLQFKIEQDEYDFSFNIILLQPLEVKAILESPLGVYVVGIEDYANGESVEESEIMQYVSKFGNEYESEEDTWFPSRNVDIVSTISDFNSNFEEYEDRYFD